MLKPSRSSKVGQMSFMLIRWGLALYIVYKEHFTCRNRPPQTPNKWLYVICVQIQKQYSLYDSSYSSIVVFSSGLSRTLDYWDEQNCRGPVQAHHWAVRFKMCLLWDNLSPEPVTWLLESGWVMGGRSCALLKSDIRFDCLRAKMRCCFFFIWLTDRCVISHAPEFGSVGILRPISINGINSRKWGSNASCGLSACRRLIGPFLFQVIRFHPFGF